MSYREWQIDNNHQFACAMRDDPGIVVKLLGIAYRFHNWILGLIIRCAS